jgi:hypothetical protein
MPLFVVITPNNPIRTPEWAKFCDYYGITYNHGTGDFMTQIYGANVRISTINDPITKITVSYFNTKPHAVARISLLILHKFIGLYECSPEIIRFMTAEIVNLPKN